MKSIIRFFVLILCFTSCSLLNSDGSGSERTIAFSATVDGVSQVFTMHENGSDIQQLTGFQFGARLPDWSPDGKTVAFNPGMDGATEQIWVMDPDGGNQHPLVLDPHTGNPVEGILPAWNPDGSEVAFEGDASLQVAQIYVASLQNGTIDTLTDGPGPNHHAEWNMDGTRLLFNSKRDYVDAESGRFRKDLYVINRDGSGLRRLTENGYIDYYTWTGDDDVIIYSYLVPGVGDYKKIIKLNLETMEESEIFRTAPDSYPIMTFFLTSENELKVIQSQRNDRTILFHTIDLNGNILEEKALSNGLFKQSHNFHMNYYAINQPSDTDQ